MMGPQTYTALGFLTLYSIAFAQIGDKCVMNVTLEEGECKIHKQCPIVEEQAKSGIAPSLCGWHELITPIVCCPVDNKFNATDDIIVYEDELPQILLNINSSNNNNNNNNPRISQRKCEQFYKDIIVNIEGIPIVTNQEPVIFKVIKCPKNSLRFIISGGEPALAGEFPFMAAIGFNTTADKWKCGGTLISDRFVLTAAHCAYFKGPNGPSVVRLGDVNLKNKHSQFRDYEILNIIVHPDYRPPQKYNDIALLQTKEVVRFTKYIRPACIYTEGTNEKAGVAAGWGKTDFAEDNEKGILIKVSLNIYENRICTKAYKNIDEKVLPNGITSNMMCAGELKGGKDTCQGDSGGPLLVPIQGSSCKLAVIGVTSFGKGCGAVNTPSIYTRVSQYASWIEKNVWSGN